MVSFQNRYVEYTGMGVWACVVVRTNVKSQQNMIFSCVFVVRVSANALFSLCFGLFPCFLFFAFPAKNAKVCKKANDFLRFSLFVRFSTLCSFLITCCFSVHLLFCILFYNLSPPGAVTSLFFAFS